MQAITIKYAGPTNTKDSRMVASAQAGRKSFSYDHALNIEENAIKAAKLYAESKGWKGQMAIGQDAKGDWQAVFIKEWTSFEVL